MTMSNFIRIVASLMLSTLVLAGCGQKGPLFLPGDPSTIRSTTPQQQPVQESEEDEDDDVPTSNQN
jgi:predicted small lipoprotein YifL